MAAAETAKGAKPLRRVGAGTDSIPAQLHERLQDRRAELEDTVLTRVYAVSDPAEISDPTYTEGLRTAVDAAIDYALACILGSERNPPPIPAALLVQARIAARSGVGLDTVLRRYFAGYGLLGDLLTEEAEAMGSIGTPALKGLLRRQTSLFDRLIAAVSEEHGRETPEQIQTTQRRKLKAVQQLLDGEPLDASELAYELIATHVGLIVRGPGGDEVLEALAAASGRRLLIAQPEEGTAWGWLAGQGPADPDQLERILSSALPGGSCAAFGESGHGPEGWRFTHRQARAALPIAIRGGDPVVRYADVALLASAAQDDLLTTSLRQIYLEPLDRRSGNGGALRQTLCAYIAAERNVSSAAAALCVNRKTVANRLAIVEEVIDAPIASCLAGIELALRLEEVRGNPGISPPSGSGGPMDTLSEHRPRAWSD